MKADSEQIGLALGRIPSGCSILTVDHQGRTSGMLASWVQQASFDPPMVTVCVKRGRPIQELINGARRFVLNVVGDEPTAMFKHFGKGFALDEDAFAGIETRSTDFGPKITTCIAHLGCRVRERIETGDHDIYSAEIQSADAVPGAKPYVHIRKNGLGY